MPNGSKSVLVIGGGPAGLRAAEVASAAGAEVIVCDVAAFRWSKISDRGPRRFEPDAQRAGGKLSGSLWHPTGAVAGFARGLWSRRTPDVGRNPGSRNLCRNERPRFPSRTKGCGTFARVDSSPARERSGIPNGCALCRIDAGSEGWRASFESSDGELFSPAHAIILALGGASYPETGSDGKWPAILGGAWSRDRAVGTGELWLGSCVAGETTRRAPKDCR